MNPNHISAIQKRLERGDPAEDIAEIFGYDVETVESLRPKAPKKKAVRKKAVKKA